MTQIIIDSPLVDRLLASLEPVELCDRSGLVLGRFFPQPKPEPVELCDQSGLVLGRFFPQPNPADYKSLECPISEEEIERRLNANEKTYTTAEVLAYLEKLP